MRFLALAAQALIGTTSLALALPAASNPDDVNTCCCCDSENEVVSCTKSSVVLLCSCLDVQCPADAPTSWRDLDKEPRPTLPPSTSEPEEEQHEPSDEELIDCCCCNIGKGAIVCEKKSEEDGCFCPLVMCPPEAPTIWLEPPSAPTQTSSPKCEDEDEDDEDEEEEEEDDGEVDGDEMTECCCCDTSRDVISCDVRPASEGCFCPAVVCPENAPTVWAEGSPRPTSQP